MRSELSIIEDARPLPRSAGGRTRRRGAPAGRGRRDPRHDGGRRRKRTFLQRLFRSRGAFLLFTAAAGVLVFLLILLLRPREDGEAGKERDPYRFSPEEEVAVPSEQGEEFRTLPAAIPAGEQDPLLLVNREHPLSAEYIPETAALRNGMASSRLCLPDLQDMMDDCRAAGLRPLICSSYRSYEKQASLYQAKIKYYQDRGELPTEAARLASQVVAPPGQSEHQTGLAFDIVDEGYQLLDEKQETTAVSLWLRENAANYGFIVRYPPEKTGVTGIIYEPWHYRYVGKENAGKITSSGLTLEEYLASGDGPAGASPSPSPLS